MQNIWKSVLFSITLLTPSAGFAMYLPTEEEEQDYRETYEAIHKLDASAAVEGAPEAERPTVPLLENIFKKITSYVAKNYHLMPGHVLDIAILIYVCKSLYLIKNIPKALIPFSGRQVCDKILDAFLLWMTAKLYKKEIIALMWHHPLATCTALKILADAGVLNIITEAFTPHIPDLDGQKIFVGIWLLWIAYWKRQIINHLPDVVLP